MSTLSTRKIKHDSSAVDNITLGSTGRVSVKSAGADGLVLETDNTDSTCSTRIFAKNNTYTGGMYYDDTGWNITTGSSIASASGSPKLNITRDGYVRAPSQPAFQAYRDSGHVSNNQVIVFNGVRFNIGSCYSSSTGRFTAPITGRYQFNTHTMLVNQTAGDHQISFRVNGGNYSTTNPGNGTFNVAFSLSEVIQLSANDYVDVFYYDSSSNSIYGSGGANWTGFSGYLLG